MAARTGSCIILQGSSIADRYRLMPCCKSAVSCLLDPLLVTHAKYYLALSIRGTQAEKPYRFRWRIQVARRAT
jgi:hypothetical protein